jgi:hypothetical protein
MRFFLVINFEWKKINSFSKVVYLSQPAFSLASLIKMSCFLHAFLNKSNKSLSFSLVLVLFVISLQNLIASAVQERTVSVLP